MLPERFPEVSSGPEKLQDLAHGGAHQGAEH